MFKVYKRILGSCLHIPHNAYSLIQRLKTPFLHGGEIPSEMLDSASHLETGSEGGPSVSHSVFHLQPARDLSLGEQWFCRELRTSSKWHKAQAEFTNPLRRLWLSRTQCCFAAGNVTGLGVGLSASLLAGSS